MTSIVETKLDPFIWTTIKVKKKNHQKLVKHGNWGESLDDILGRVLNELDECEKPKEKVKK
ncbi:MAG: hypothetical protein ACRD8Z_16035 [Nitrososphaeraceae archaeon]